MIQRTRPFRLDTPLKIHEGRFVLLAGRACTPLERACNFDLAQKKNQVCITVFSFFLCFCSFNVSAVLNVNGTGLWAFRVLFLSNSHRTPCTFLNCLKKKYKSVGHFNDVEEGRSSFCISNICWRAQFFNNITSWYFVLLNNIL